MSVCAIGLNISIVGWAFANPWPFDLVIGVYSDETSDVYSPCFSEIFKPHL